MAGERKRERQLPREPPIVPYLVHTLSLSPVKVGTGVVGVARWRADLSDQAESDGMRLKHQPRRSPHALSNSDDATSTVSFGQAIASSNGFAVATDPTNPFTRG